MFPGPSPGPARRQLVTVLVLALLLACDDVTVAPIPVTTVEVVPADTVLSVPDVIELSTRLYGSGGEELGGRTVQWTSEDPSVVTIDTGGIARTLSPGETHIRAEVEGVVGTARLGVRSPPFIELDPASVSFSAAQGAADVPAIEVRILNRGDEPLENLSVTVAYGGGQEGWLFTKLLLDGSPVRVRLRANPGTLRPGEHTAGLRVDSERAANGPVFLPVSLEVRGLPPEAPSDLVAAVDSGPSVLLAWTDNSDRENTFRIERSSSGPQGFETFQSLPADSTVFRDTGVAADRVYEYRVRACADVGCSTASNVATATTRPLAPGSLDASLETSTSVHLTWRDLSETETGFRIERRTGTGALTVIAHVGAGVEQYLDDELPRDAFLTYWVAACNPGGCSSPASDTVSTPPVIVPAAPSDLRATSITSSAIALSWTDNSSDEIGFRVERRAEGGEEFQPIAEPGEDERAYTDLGVAGDTRYAYRIRACGPEACSSYSAELAVTTPPSAPTELGTTALSSTSIQLSWIDNSITETSFEVERRTGTATFARVAVLAAETSSFLDAGLDAATSYDYRVRACNSGGCSSYATAAATTQEPPPPAAPSGLTATSVAADRIRLTWSDQSVDESAFRVERRGAGQADFGLIAETGAGVETYDDPVTAEGVYTYRVQACHEYSCSTYSPEAEAVTVPAPPAAPAAVALSSSEIRLTWADTSGVETGFEIERRSPGGTYSVIATAAQNATSFTDSGLLATTTYEYRLRACNDSGCSSYATAAATTQEPPPPTPPSGLTATAVGDERVSLRWTDNSEDETEFRIERQSYLFFSEIGRVDADDVTFTDRTVDEEHTYSYRVLACNAHGCSDPSNTITVTTRSD